MSFELMVPILTRLQMPSEVIDILRSFYGKVQRLLSYRGVVSAEWQRPGRGLIQGCPFSPVVATCLMLTWSCLVKDRHTECLSFLDDRSVWPAPETDQNNDEVVMTASRKSKHFDDVFDLQCDPRQSSVSGGTELQSVADKLGYGRVPHLSALGLVHSLEGEPCRMKKFSLEKACQRLRFVAAATRHPWQVLQHIRSLGLSTVQWAAGFAMPTEEQIDSITQSIRQAFSINLTHEAPPVLYNEVLDWRADPRCALDWAAVSAGLRLHDRPSTWLEEVSVLQATKSWLKALPALDPVFRKLGWTVSADGHKICWRDANCQRRQFWVGWESTNVLREWMLHFHRRKALAKSSRVRKSLHRTDPHLARGLDLPAPPLGGFLKARGHVALWKRSPPGAVRQTALATGGSWWHARPRFYPTGPAPSCLCGLSQPSRAHLLWVCPSTVTHRCNLNPPQNRAEERLFAILAEEEPPAPRTTDCIVDQLSKQVREMCSKHETLYVATDGSSRDNIGAAAIVISSAEDDHNVFTQGLSGEDQSAYRAEVCAVRWLLIALSQVPLPPRQTFVSILIDCEAAMTAILSGGGCSCFLLVQDTRNRLRNLQARGWHIHLSWIPSHGKSSSRWRPLTEVPTSQQRSWNALADESARACVNDLWMHSDRAAFARRARDNQKWEERTILAAAASAELFYASASGS